MLNDKYNLLWNGYKENSLSCFKEAHSQLEFSDVTLVSDDDKHIKSHKFILSSCSPGFRKILVNNPHQHPLIYLDNVKHEDLRSIIDFMYLGEAEVAQDDLDNFMRVASRFQVKGLSLNESTKPSEEGLKQQAVNSCVEYNNLQNEVETIEEASKPHEVNNCVEYNHLENEVDGLYAEHSSIKEEFDIPSERTVRSTGNFVNHQSTNLDSTQNFECDKCSYQTSDKRNFNRHIKTLHSSFMLSCNHCDFQSKRSDNLRKHQQNKHGFQ